jgi:hypothetical protein
MHRFCRFALVLLLFAVPASAAQSQTFPVSLRGKTLELGTGSDRAGLAAVLHKLFSPAPPSVATPERIQYDFVAVAGQAPVTLACDFDAKGRLTGVILDAFAKEQNPVAVTLADWLRQHVGPGNKAKKTTTWSYAGFVFRLTVVLNAGEDSMYRLDIVRK